MGRQRWLTGLALAILFAALGWLLLGPAPEVSEKPVATSRTEAMAPAGTQPEQATPLPSPATPAPDNQTPVLRAPANPPSDLPEPQDPVTYYGRIQQVDGRPIADVAIELWTERQQIGQLTSDVAGLFSFTAPSGNHWLVVPQSDRWHEEQAHNIDPSNEIIVTLKARGEHSITAFGKVTRPDGDPLPNVHVSHVTDSANTQTDKAGDYRFTYRVYGYQDPYLIGFFWAGKQGSVHHHESISHDQHVDDTVRVDVVLSDKTNNVPLVVTVVDENHAPLAAMVRLISRNTWSGSSTDRAGRVEEWVEPGSIYSIEASVTASVGRAYDTKVVEDVEIGEAGLELVLQLEPTEHGSLVGTVVDPLGVAVAGFDLELGSQASSRPFATLSTDADGSFALDSVMPGELWLRSRGRGFVSWGASIAPGQITEIIVLADAGTRMLQGRIVDADNNPLGGVQVKLNWSFPEGIDYAMSPMMQFKAQTNWPPAGYATSLSRRNTVTDVDGTFTLFDLADVAYELSLVVIDPVSGARSSHQAHPATVKPSEGSIDILALPPSRGR